MAPDLSATRQILEAVRFAADSHACQRRKGAAGEPYVNHVIEVASSIASVLSEPDTNLIVAALLHDTIEDTAVTAEEVTAKFGTDVASLVLEVTDNKSLPKAERKRLQVVNAPKKSVRAQYIKLADKISNLRALLESPPPDWTTQRKREYFDWARQVVDGLKSPDPKLKAEFDRLYAQVGKFAEVSG